MSDQSASPFFESLARIEENAVSSAREALQGAPPIWAERPEVFVRLAEVCSTGEAAEDFAAAVWEFVHVAIHSALVVMDGGAADADVDVQLTDGAGNSMGSGLHERFVDYLFETNRLE